MPFFKIENNGITSADSIDGAGFSLSETSKGEYTYPVDGWYWFADLDAAMAGISQPAGIVSMRKARLALLGAGLLDSVNTAIAAMPGIEGEAARIEWEYATEVDRNSALVSGLAGALGLTDAQLDGLFVVAAGI